MLSSFLLSRPVHMHTGAKQREEIYEAFENIFPILEDFRKGDAAALPASLGAMPPPPAPLPAPAAALMEPPPSSVPLLLPSSPHRGNNLPPPTPLHPGVSGHQAPLHLPPPTPLHHHLPPPTPHHQGPASMLPHLPPPTPRPELPPPTPMHPHVSSML